MENGDGFALGPCLAVTSKVNFESEEDEDYEAVLQK